MPSETDGTVVEPTAEHVETETAGKAQRPSTQVVDGKSAAEWATSYKGLQGAYQKLQNTTTDQIASLTAKLEEATQKIEEMSQGGTSKDSQLATLQKQVSDLNEKIQTLTNEKEALNKRLNRSSLVMKEFPQLAEWESQGLLPVAETDEELTEVLKKFNENLAKQVGSGVKKTMAGATPPGSGKTDATQTSEAAGDESEDYIWNQMIAYAGRDQAKYDEWRAKFDAIQKS